ncbi:Putative ABC-transporter type IV [Sporobacter termitidis DSM 10068]|uniref:Putative ABC-transporter type IV n=1 Tax=Sporobacter termitidis DSM 10068 TaxID=1123282 RepID=A0A1M5UPE9_9FIRM|nr:hypothetical protein [Sporobacter termitidis]SHH64820.1 Putative ABC-transporter type IV [Sporobacter termitidis DSM 10068]
MTLLKLHMIKTLKYAGIFKSGGLVYGALELAFRGRTHWTMMLAGGVCAIFLYLIATKSREALWKKWIMGGAVITTVEFVTGIVVNIVLGWNVWSYANSWANLFGQICLLFSLLWVGLSIPGIWVMTLVGRRFFKEG